MYVPLKMSKHFKNYHYTKKQYICSCSFDDIVLNFLSNDKPLNEPITGLLDKIQVYYWINYNKKAGNQVIIAVNLN